MAEAYEEGIVGDGDHRGFGTVSRRLKQIEIQLEYYGLTLRFGLPRSARITTSLAFAA